MARSSVAVATHLGGAVAAQAHTAFADGMHLALLIAAGIAAAAAITVATLLRRRPGQAPGDPRGDGSGGVLRSPHAGAHEAGDVPAQPAAELDLSVNVMAAPGRTGPDARTPQVAGAVQG